MSQNKNSRHLRHFRDNAPKVVSSDNPNTGLLESMSYRVKAIKNSYADHGEGPHWDVDTQSLYYVNQDLGMLLRYDYKYKRVFRAKIVGEKLASFVIPIEGEEEMFAVGIGRRLMAVHWNGLSGCAHVVRRICAVQQTDERHYGNRFNDGKCDPCGRLFAGTMRYVGDEFQYRYGELFKVVGGKPFLAKSNIGISNGMAWNRKTDKFYFIDTAAFTVKEYFYNFATGTICPGKAKIVFKINTRDGPLWPDGMTIDTDGNIYIATFNGHTIFKVDPNTCKILLEIKLPCKRITSCAFGGPHMNILFVTTSTRFGERAPAGTVYKVTGLGVRGLPMTKMRIKQRPIPYFNQ